MVIACRHRKATWPAFMHPVQHKNPFPVASTHNGVSTPARLSMFSFLGCDLHTHVMKGWWGGADVGKERGMGSGGADSRYITNLIRCAEKKVHA